MSDDDLIHLAHLTGEDDRGYRHTYSDLRHRVIPAAFLSAFPDAKLTLPLLIEAIQANPPTPPFTK